ncbi:MAG: hypothetical protein V8S98_13375 [Lachnospiraceae bacterium]
MTSEKTYIRAGKSTQKTGTARSFAVSGDRYIGDPAEDFMLSHEMKYAKGNAAVTNYVYFCILNGKGEKGQVSVIVNSEGGGNAGESSSIDINLQEIWSRTRRVYIFCGIRRKSDADQRKRSGF